MELGIIRPVTGQGLYQFHPSADDLHTRYSGICADQCVDLVQSIVAKVEGREVELTIAKPPNDL